MEFFQLDHFVAVVEERSFTRAAERVFAGKAQ
jgi:DNA-binding transcriptional LysR family regulator